MWAVKTWFSAAGSASTSRSPCTNATRSALVALETKDHIQTTNPEQTTVPNRASIFLRPVGVWTSWIFVNQRAEVAPQRVFRRRAWNDAKRRKERRDKDAVNPVGDKGCDAKSHASTGASYLLVSLFTFGSPCEGVGRT